MQHGHWEANKAGCYFPVYTVNHGHLSCYTVKYIERDWFTILAWNKQPKLPRQMALPTPLTTFSEHSCCPSSVSSCHLAGENNSFGVVHNHSKIVTSCFCFLKGAEGETQLPSTINKYHLFPTSFPLSLPDKMKVVGVTHQGSVWAIILYSPLTYHTIFSPKPPVVALFFLQNLLLEGKFSSVNKFRKTWFKCKQHSSASQSSQWSQRADERKDLSVRACGSLHQTPTMLFYTSASLTGSWLFTF